METFLLTGQLGYNDIWRALIGVDASFLSMLGEILPDSEPWHLYLFLGCFHGIVIENLRPYEDDLKKAPKVFKYRRNFWDNLFSKGSYVQVLSTEQFYRLDQYFRKIALGYHREKMPRDKRTCDRYYREMVDNALERQPELAKILEGFYKRNPAFAPPTFEECLNTVEPLSTPEEFYKAVLDWQDKGEAPSRISWKANYWFLKQAHKGIYEKYGDIEKTKQLMLDWFEPDNIKKVLRKIRNGEIKKAPYRTLKSSLTAKHDQLQDNLTDMRKR